MKMNRKAAVLLLIAVTMLLTVMSVEAKYTGYVDYESIYNEKNYESEFDINTVIAVMQPEEWCGAVDAYSERGIFDGIDIKSIEMLSPCREISDDSFGDVLILNLNDGSREKVLSTIELLKSNEYVIYSFPNYIESPSIDDEDTDDSQDSYYLTDGVFSCDRGNEGTEIIGLYKDGVLLNSVVGKEINIDGIQFDTLRVFLWSDLDNGMKPLKTAMELSYDEVIAAERKEEPMYGDIPSVYLTGDMTDISKETRVTLAMTYKSETETIEGYASAKWQGNNALNFEKKNYAIKLYKDGDLNKKLKIQLKDWDKSNNYVLKANWIDSTAARNIVSARLYETLPNVTLPSGSSGVVDGFPVRLYLNDEFVGLYTWNKPKKGWVFGMDGDNENEMIYFSNYALGSGLFERKYSSDYYWELVYPDEHTSTEEFDRVTGFVAESTDEEFKEHIGEYIDIDSLLNFYVFSQVILNVDGTGKNMNMATYDGKLWYVCPYDMDATYGLQWYGSALKDYTEDMSETNLRNSVLWRKLEDNFPQEIYDRYVLLRNNQLSEESILAAFRYFMNEVGEDLYAEDLERWQNQPSKSYGYEQIEDFLNTRYPYLDEFMERFNLNK